MQFFDIFCLQFICCALWFTPLLDSCSTSTLSCTCHVPVCRLTKFSPPSLNKGAKVFSSSNHNDDEPKNGVRRWWRQCGRRCRSCSGHWVENLDYCVLRRKKLQLCEGRQHVCVCVCVLYLCVALTSAAPVRHQHVAVEAVALVAPVRVHAPVFTRPRLQAALVQVCRGRERVTEWERRVRDGALVQRSEVRRSDYTPPLMSGAQGVWLFVCVCVNARVCVFLVSEAGDVLEEVKCHRVLTGLRLPLLLLFGRWKPMSAVNLPIS